MHIFMFVCKPHFLLSFSYIFMSTIIISHLHLPTFQVDVCAEADGELTFGGVKIAYYT